MLNYCHSPEREEKGTFSKSQSKLQLFDLRGLTASVKKNQNKNLKESQEHHAELYHQLCREYWADRVLDTQEKY